MEYYNPIDHSSKRIAAVVTVAVMAIMAVLCSYISFDVHALERDEAALNIVFEEMTEITERATMEQRAPSDVRRDNAPAHLDEARTEQSMQSAGEAEKTQTINPNALFKPVAGNSAEQLPTGNRLAPEGDSESNKGEGEGYNLHGTDQLDAGLRGRGLREGLPHPSASYNVEGTVVVYVTVDSNGNVTSAEIRQQGSTTQDATLRRLAIEAARKAKFKPSPRLSQGGTITYVFKLR